MLKKEHFIFMVIGSICFSVSVLSAAAFDESEEKSGLPASSVTIFAPKRKSENQMQLMVVRRYMKSDDEIEVRKLIQEYCAEDPSISAKENSKKIRKLLKKIFVQHSNQLSVIIESMGMNGCNVFHVAAAKNHKKLVASLLKYDQDVLNSKTLSWNTALHLAYRYGAKKVVVFLEAQPGINKEIKNIDGQIASHVPQEKNKSLNEAEGFSLKKDRAKQNEK